MSIVYRANLNMDSGTIPIAIHVGQYDDDFSIVFVPYSTNGVFTIEEDTTAEIRGTKRDGNGYSAAATIDSTVTPKTVTVEGATQMTAIAGKNPFEIVFKKNGKTVSSANFNLVVEHAAMDAETVVSESVIQEIDAVVEEYLEDNDTALLAKKVNTPLSGGEADFGTAGQVLSTLGNGATEWVDMTATGGGGTPIVARTAADMTDHDAIYVYVGSESGYVNGHWYYYSEGAWVDSGQYGVGINGEDGEDGFSPIVTVNESQIGVEISVTDKNGTTTASVENGTATDAQVAAWLDDHPEATTSVKDGSISVKKTNFWDINLLEGHYKANGYTRGTLNEGTGVVTENATSSYWVTDLLPLYDDCFTSNFVVFATKGGASQGLINNRHIVAYKDGVFVKMIALGDMWTDKATVGHGCNTNLTTQGTIEDFNQIRVQVNYGNEVYYSGDTTIIRANITDLTVETYVMTDEFKTLLQDGLQVNTPNSVTEEIIADGAVTTAKIADKSVEPRKLSNETNLMTQATLLFGKYLGNAGVMTSDNAVTAFIPVETGKTYIVNYVPTNYYFYGFYVKNDGTGSAIGGNYAVNKSDESYSITVPDNSDIKYLALSAENKNELYAYGGKIFTWKVWESTDSEPVTEYSFPWLKLGDESKVLSSPFRGKIVVATGDSITENNSRNDNKSWCMYLPEKLGMTVYNDGKSGTGLVKSYQSLHSMLYRIENQWDTDYSGITPDIILIMGNMNDGTGTGTSGTNSLNDLGISGWSSSGYLAVGDLSDDINTQSVYGCAKRVLEDLITKYPLSKIGWILSTPRMGTVPYWTGKENLYGHGWFEDYITAIRYQCEQYNVPVLDLYHESQFRPTNSTNMNAYMDDGTTHPNTAGTKKYMVEPIVKWIEQYFGET